MCTSLWLAHTWFKNCLLKELWWIIVMNYQTHQSFVLYVIPIHPIVAIFSYLPFMVCFVFSQYPVISSSTSFHSDDDTRSISSSRVSWSCVDILFDVTVAIVTTWAFIWLATYLYWSTTCVLQLMVSYHNTVYW